MTQFEELQSAQELQEEQLREVEQELDIEYERLREVSKKIAALHKRRVEIKLGRSLDPPAEAPKAKV
jgi:flagellar motility protein MotE (MotC chaperone)